MIEHPDGPDDTIAAVIDSRERSVEVCAVAAGEHWHFQAVGKWIDWFVKCDADGYRVALFEFLDVRPQLRDAPWFALIGCVRETGEAFVVGKGGDHTFATSGQLVAYANDLSAMRWNNRGAVRLTATRLDSPPTPTPSTTLPSSHSWLVQNWLDFNKTLDRTPGFLFLALLLGALGYALARMQAGRDLVAAVVQNRSGGGSAISRGLIFLWLTTFTLGFQAWFWARAIVDYHYGDRRIWRDSVWLVWVPRLFGMFPYAALVIALSLCGEGLDWAVIVLLAIGAAFLLAIIFRMPIADRLRSYAAKLEARQKLTAARAVRGSLLNLKSIVMVTGVVLSIVSLVIVWNWHVAPALFFGPPAVVLLGATLLVPIMVLLIQLGHRYRIPAVVALFLMAVLFSTWVDNHGVRLLDTPKDNWAVAHRPSLEQAYSAWRAKVSPGPDGTIPIIFVAAPGGASRAGFWTARALAQLEEQTGGEFSRHLFAISSISGSSVGTTGFLASLKDNANLVPKHQLLPALDDFAGKDFLSSTLAGMFYVDLLQRFVPISIFPDRAEYLEDGFESGWKKHCSDLPGRCVDDSVLSSSFMSLWSNLCQKWLPILVIGGAREESGRRILTSNVQLDNTVDADDFFTVVGHDVRLSTAIDNGARFPYVSPSGTLAAWEAGQGGHIVDGGYFDAAGVETLRELAGAVLAKHGSIDHLHAIFVVLSNAPVGSSGWVTPLNIASDAIGPVWGLYQSGPAHGSHLRDLLFREQDDGTCTLTDCQEPPVSVFDIQACAGSLPLDWALSNGAKEALRQQLLDKPVNCQNQAHIKMIASLLRN